MKTYIVYINGLEVLDATGRPAYIKAAGQNAAEKKAKAKYAARHGVQDVSVSYTEI